MTTIPLALDGELRSLNQTKKICIGQELPEYTPVEIVGYEVYEAGSPLALDNGWFTEKNSFLNAPRMGSVEINSKSKKGAKK